MPTKDRWRRALVAGLLAASLRPALAAVKLEGMRWQMAAGPSGRQFKDVAEVSLPDGAFKVRLLARLRVTNDDVKLAEGILLRYALCAKLVPAREGAESVWAVPFIVEEKRIPRIGARQSIETRVEPTREMVKRYVTRMARAGYRLQELMIQVMVEPRPGQQGAVQVTQAVLKVLK
ncbi:MAG: hypothetical protein HY927_16090 [Elusimicrobia bacterium]|nr:hypothetical protein [Elusimicrobiota bacterium]